MWVKTKNYLVDSYCFRIEETKDRIEGYYWLVIAENKERNIIIGRYKTLEEAQKVLEHCWDSLTHGVMWINASADYIDRYVLHKVTEAENFDARRNKKMKNGIKAKTRLSFTTIRKDLKLL